MNKYRQNRIDFLKRYTENPADELRKRQQNTRILPLAIAVGLIAAVEGFLLIQSFLFVYPALNKANRYIQSPANVAAYNSGVQLQAEHAAVAAEINTLQQTAKFLSTYPAFTPQLYDEVLLCAGTTVQLNKIQFDRDLGIAYFNCASPNIADAANFTASLLALGRFGSVSYYGYEMLDFGTGINEYVFLVTCTLPAAEGSVG